MAEKQVKVLLAASLVLAFAVCTQANYIEVIPFSTMKGVDSTISLHQICNSQGDTAYSIVRAGAASPYHSYVIKTTDLGGTPTSVALTDTAGPAWAGMGVDYILPGNTLAFVGNDLMFSDTRSHQLYKVDMTTGTPSVYLSRAQLMAQTGGARMAVNNGVTPWGEFVFYEPDTKQVFVTTGPGSVSLLISSTELQNAQGNMTVSGGLTYDASNNLYWGNTTSRSMWRRDTEGAITEILSTADITAVTGAANTGFGDIFYAPDGLVYFRDTTAKAILSFDPTAAVPASTLAFVLTQAQLEAGPAGTGIVDPLSWYAGTNNLAFSTISQGNQGYYSIPEPAALALLAFGSLVLVRRRMR